MCFFSAVANRRSSRLLVLGFPRFAVAAAMVSAKSSRLGDFKEMVLIGKGSFGRVYRAVRLSDNIE